MNRYKAGDQDTRPWGRWIVLDADEGHVVKRIEVLPDKRLSLQYHNHREEFWFCVSGKGKAHVDARETVMRQGDWLHIPCKATHRIENCFGEPFVILEIQKGESLDENDIIRIEDDFGRV